jgi:hypothetical protein
MHKVYTAAIIAALGFGIYIGKSYYSRTETVEVEKEVIRKDIQTVVREIVRPDGTRSTETVTTDKSKEKRDSQASTTVVAPPLPNWHISASYARTLENPAPVYGLQVEKRLLGPFSVGLRAQSDKYVGLVIGYEF